MIIIYYRSRCRSSRKAVRWLERHLIPFRKCRIEQLSKENLTEILSLSEGGFTDILKKSDDFRTQVKIEHLSKLSYNQAINFLSYNTEILRSPLIISYNKLLVGHNDVEIRMFIPQTNRKIIEFLDT